MRGADVGFYRYWKLSYVISMVSCQKGPTRHAYAWQIGPFWQDTIDMCLKILYVKFHSNLPGAKQFSPDTVRFQAICPQHDDRWLCVDPVHTQFQPQLSQCWSCTQSRATIRLGTITQKTINHDQCLAPKPRPHALMPTWLSTWLWNHPLTHWPSMNSHHLEFM